jgi:hypothetical protein
MTQVIKKLQLFVYLHVFYRNKNNNIKCRQPKLYSSGIMYQKSEFVILQKKKLQPATHTTKNQFYLFM